MAQVQSDGDVMGHLCCKLDALSVHEYVPA